MHVVSPARGNVTLAQSSWLLDLPGLGSHTNLTSVFPGDRSVSERSSGVPLVHGKDTYGCRGPCAELRHLKYYTR